MAKFLLLYHGGGMPETEAEQAAVMQAWGGWYTGLGNALVDPGNPFTPQAQSVGSDGTIGDGPIGAMASGYTIVTADSLGAATAMAKSCPILQAGGQVSVYETFDVM